MVIFKFGDNMKKIISIIIIGILILSGIGALTASSSEKQISTMNTTFCFEHFNVIENKDETISLQLKGADEESIRHNQYVLPTRIETFTFPLGTKINAINCVPRDIHEKTVTKDVMISPTPVIYDQGISEKSDSSQTEPTSVSQWYEYDIGVGIKGSKRYIFVKVQTFPVQYNAEDQLVKWAENIEIEIEYNEPKVESLNYADEYDFIILTPSKYQSDLVDLKTHKNNRGISTNIVTLDEIYYGTYFAPEGRDDPEKIKYFIKNAIEKWNTSAVLLVGGKDDFPTRLTHVYVDYNQGDDEIFATDLYYADIYNETQEFASWDTNNNGVFGEYQWEGNTDDVDLYPDVHLGRLACVDSSEVTTCVEKIITYETNEAYVQDWFTNLVVIGGDTSPNDGEGDVNEGEVINQEIINIMEGFVPTKCWASEGTLKLRTYIDNAINDGAGFVDFSGHGNPSSWSTHPHNQDIWIPVGGYENTNVQALNNGDKLPVVVTGACSVAKFVVRDDCFTWSFLPNPDGGGIAAFGPSSLSWGYTGTYCTSGLGGKMQLELFKAYADHNAITTGEMWTRAINHYISPGMDGGDHKTVQQWQPFSDPTTAIADESLPPSVPAAPEGPDSGKAGTLYSYSASTTDPEGDMISYLFDWGDGTYSEWTDFVDSGETVTASHTWDEKGDYEIRVKAKDDHGVQSDWSEPSGVSMPKRNNVDLLSQFLLNHPMLKKIVEFYSF